MIPLLTLILGLLVGYYGRQVYDMLADLIEDLEERQEARSAGVVRPQVSKMTRNQPIDLSRETGPIMKMTPEQHALQRIKERDERARRL